MSRLTYFILITGILSLFSASAQEKKYPVRMVALVNPSELFIGFWHDAALQPVDTMHLEAVYKLKYRMERGTGPHLEMLTVVQIGDPQVKYYSMIRQFTDDIQIAVMQQAKGLPAVPGVGVQHKYTEEERRIQSIAGTDRINSEIWMNHSNRKLIERMHDYDMDNLSIEYEEDIPKFDWSLLEQTDTICGYPCYTAKTTFRGRDWTVWYTHEIPFAAGPWKFNGLPGLILKVQDRDMDYIWECQSLVQKNDPIVYYEVESKLLSRKDWRRYLRLIHESPLSVLGHNGECEIYIKNKLVTEADNWSIPYNPIELD